MLLYKIKMVEEAKYINSMIQKDVELKERRYAKGNIFFIIGLFGSSSILDNVDWENEIHHIQEELRKIRKDKTSIYISNWSECELKHDECIPNCRCPIWKQLDISY